MPSEIPHWICCQIGSREHYAIPRALAGRGRLEAFYTDAWVRPASFLNRVAPLRLRERHHPDLTGQPVTSRTASLLLLEACWRLRSIPEWPRIIRRNQWFQRWVVRQLKAARPGPAKKILFSYSYAARDIFSFARSQGWQCVLGQIDPGIVHEQILTQLYSQGRWSSPDRQKVPSEYWANWRQECELADVIVVNSKWSREALIQTGLPPGKIVVVPLVYEAPSEANSFKRQYPRMFSEERPLRLLFLGQVTIGKGINEIREAMEQLCGEPVELWLVGPDRGGWPKRESDPLKVRHFGPVSRSETGKFYREADLFLFPSHSDGFGLTQLEAQAWKLPIIASRNCGEVVVHGVNGLLLDKVQSTSIAASVRQLLHQPGQLEALSAGSRTKVDFSLDDLAERLEAVSELGRRKQVQRMPASEQLNLSR